MKLLHYTLQWLQVLSQLTLVTQTQVVVILSCTRCNRNWKQRVFSLLAIIWTMYWSCVGSFSSSVAKFSSRCSLYSPFGNWEPPQYLHRCPTRCLSGFHPYEQCTGVALDLSHPPFSYPKLWLKLAHCMAVESRRLTFLLGHWVPLSWDLHLTM